MARTNTGAVVATIVTLSFTATTPSATPTGKSELRTFIESVDDSIPSEFAADLLIRVATSRRAAAEDATWLTSILERAFTLANTAQEQHRRRALPWTHARTLEAVSTIGRTRGLDKTSLQARAIGGLISIEPHRAIDLLKSLPTTVPRLECADTLMYEAGPPYETMAALIRSLQAPLKNLRNAGDERLARDLLQSRIARLETSAEIAPTIDAVLMVDLPADQTAAVMTNLAERLRSVRDDDWTFTGNLLRTFDAVQRLVDAFSRTQRVAVGTLVGAFRSYLVTHFQTRRCSLSGHDIGAILDIEQVVIAEANMVLAYYNQPPLRREDLRGSHTIASVRPRELWRSPQASRVRDALDALGLSANAKAADRERARGSLNDALLEWTTADEPSSRLYFHQRCLALTAAMQYDDSLRVEFVDELVTLLMRYAGLVPRVDWFAHVSVLLDVTLTNAAVQADMRRAFERSGDPVLTRYARLETILN
jgi:hypothetical protein